MIISNYCINPDCRGIIRYHKDAADILCPYCGCAFLVSEFRSEKEKVEAAIRAGEEARAALALTSQERDALQALLNQSNQAWVENVRLQEYISLAAAKIMADTAALKEDAATLMADTDTIKAYAAGVKEDTDALLSGQKAISRTLQAIREKQHKHDARYADTLERAFVTLEVEAFDEARELFEDVLKIAPKEPQAYLGKLLAEMHVTQPADLAKCKTGFQNNVNYKLLMKFGDDAIRSELSGYLEQIALRDKEEQEKKNAKPAAKEDASKTKPGIGLTAAAAAATFLLGPHAGSAIIAVGKAMQKGSGADDSSGEQAASAVKPPAQMLRQDLRSRIALTAKGTIALTAGGEILSTNTKPFDDYSRAVWKQVRQIACDIAGNCVGLLENGTVTATNPLLMNYVKSWRNIQSIAFSATDVIGLREDGKLEIQNTFLLPGDKGPLQGDKEKKLQWYDIRSISGTFYAECAACLKNGTVTSVGHGFFTERKLAKWMNIQAVSCSESHVLGLTKDGRVLAASTRKDVGQCNVDGWRDIIAIEAGDSFSVGLRKDGTVVATGSNTHGQCNVDSWRDIVAIAAGYEHVVGVRADGSLVAAGVNTLGQCNVDSWNLMQ